MRKLEGNTTLIIIIIVLAVLLAAAIGFGAYFWGKNKSTTKATATPTKTTTTSSKTSPTATPTKTPTAAQTSEETPKQVVENFMKYTLGTLPGAQVDLEKARGYLSDTMKAQYSGEGWVPQFYGIQDGPDSVKFISENTSDDGVYLRYDPNWGEMSLGWSFFLAKDGNKYYIDGFRNDTQ